MALQNYYSTAATVLARLNPSDISSPQTAEDLLIAHLVFKCLVKTATWAWSRIKHSDQASMKDLEPWVCLMLLKQLPFLTTVLKKDHSTIPKLRCSAANNLRASHKPHRCSASRFHTLKRYCWELHRYPYSTYTPFRKILPPSSAA